MPVSVSPPIAKKVIQWDEYSGRFEARAVVEIRARVSGFVEKLHFQDGQMVNAGDPLFTIDKRPYEIAVESATADVARNKAQVELAELQVQRGNALVASRNIPEAENDTRKSTLAVNKAQLKAAEAALRNAQLNLEWTEVTAPLAGRISDRKVDPGNLIQGGQQGATLLATIVATDPIYFLFDVSESDYLRYQRLYLEGAPRAGRQPDHSGAHQARRRNRLEAHGQDRLRRQRAEPALGHHPHPRHRREQGPPADARRVRPRPALWRRVRRAADPRLRRRVRPGAQDRVRGRTRTMSSKAGR